MAQRNSPSHLAKRFSIGYKTAQFPKMASSDSVVSSIDLY